MHPSAGEPFVDQQRFAALRVADKKHITTLPREVSLIKVSSFDVNRSSSTHRVDDRSNLGWRNAHFGLGHHLSVS